VGKFGDMTPILETALGQNLLQNSLLLSGAYLSGESSGIKGHQPDRAKVLWLSETSSKSRGIRWHNPNCCALAQGLNSYRSSVSNILIVARLPTVVSSTTVAVSWGRRWYCSERISALTAVGVLA
jgi:hypothetical protein